MKRKSAGVELSEEKEITSGDLSGNVPGREIEIPDPAVGQLPSNQAGSFWWFREIREPAIIAHANSWRMNYQRRGRY